VITAQLAASSGGRHYRASAPAFGALDVEIVEAWFARAPKRVAEGYAANEARLDYAAI
jgi:hypothetical protein